MGSEEHLPFVCECGDIGCEKCVPMTPEEYAELPKRPPGLALAPGHGLFPAEKPAADR